MAGFLDIASNLLQGMAGAFGRGGADPLSAIAQGLNNRAPDPLSAIANAVSGGRGADPLGAILGGGHGGGADPFGALASIVSSHPRPAQQYEESKKAIADERRAAQGTARAGGTVSNPNLRAFPADQQGTAQQIVQMAVSQYGPSAGPVVAAMLQAEGGLGGVTGDNNQSFGPFQFYAGGQLPGFAQARGVDPATAGQLARTNPLDAAQWALSPQGYLGQALQQGVQAGLTDERLLQRALQAQNPGALAAGSPEYARYQQALQQQYQAPAAPVTAPGGYLFPVQGYQGQISAHHGSVRGGSDIMAPEGTPVVAMRGGTVLSIGSDGPGGNNVLIQGDDGNQYYYAHFRDAPLVRGGRVETGTPLGFVGRTGNAAGTPPHLHIGIGPSIVNGVGPLGGTGGDYDALGLLMRAYTGGGGR